MRVCACEQDLALNNLQRSICRETQPTNQPDYADSTSTKGQDTPNEDPRYDTKLHLMVEAPSLEPWRM